MLPLKGPCMRPKNIWKVKRTPWSFTDFRKWSDKLKKNQIQSVWKGHTWAINPKWGAKMIGQRKVVQADQGNSCWITRMLGKSRSHVFLCSSLDEHPMVHIQEAWYSERWQKLEQKCVDYKNVGEGWKTQRIHLESAVQVGKKNWSFSWAS